VAAFRRRKITDTGRQQNATFAPCRGNVEPLAQQATAHTPLLVPVGCRRASERRWRFVVRPVETSNTKAAFLETRGPRTRQIDRVSASEAVTRK